MSKRTRTELSAISWLSAAAFAARTAAERFQNEGPEALEKTSSVRIIRKHSAMPLEQGKDRAAPVGPVVAAGLEDDTRRQAMLGQERPELRGDSVQAVDVLGAGAQMRRAGRRDEVQSSEVHT